jgi:putative ABC transport system ATP-binding protein
LYEINLDIKKGEFVVVLGPSGCGKSSLLNIMASLELPDNGTVLINDIDILKMKPIDRTRFHRNKMGMVFQSYNLISTLSVLNNVALPQIFVNEKKHEREKRAMSLLERFGIKEQWKKIPSELSGGQQQRIGIARSIINNPPIILADEPVGNLDSESANNVMQIMSELNKDEGKTVILVSHNPENADWGSHIVHMKDGRVVKEEWKDALGASKEIETSAEAGKSRFDKMMDKFRGLSEKQIGMLMEPLKAKVIAESFLIPYGNSQVKLIEESIKLRLAGIYDTKMLLEQLDKNEEDGGAGLDARTARKFAFGIEELIDSAKNIFEEISPREKAEAVLRSLLSQEDIEVKEEDYDKVVNLVQKKINNEISHLEFSELLDLPKNEGGVGLDKRTVQKFLRYMDLVLIVGYGLDARQQN